MKVLLITILLAAAMHAETFTYWIEPCSRPEAECESGDVQLAEWALNAWEKASGGNVTFVKSRLSRARIRLYWASSGNRGLYGEARPITVDDQPGAELAIRPDLHALGHKIEGEGTRDRMEQDMRSAWHTRSRRQISCTASNPAGIFSNISIVTAGS